MRSFQLIHNMLAGPLPTPLARTYRNWIISGAEAVESEFSRCGRCGDDVFAHVWILRNPNVTEQDGVIDCERVVSAWRA